MIYFCCYDIQSDKIRRKVIRVLEEYGERVQKSIFMLPVPAATIRKILARLDKYVTPKDALLILGVEQNTPVICRGPKKIKPVAKTCVL